MSNTVDIRGLVLEILLDIAKNGEYSHTALAHVLEKYQYLEKKDRAFMTRVVEGVLENQIALDYVLDHFSKVPTAKMKPAIRCILRSAVYQLRFMDAVPDAAACSEAVRLAKKKGFSNLSGFVNGVLRNIARNKEEPAMPDQKQDPLRYLSVRYSIPEWMIQMWEAEFSYHFENAADFHQMETMLAAFQAPAPITIRTDTSRITPQTLMERLKAEGASCIWPGGPDAGMAGSLFAELPYALQITGCDYLKALPSFKEGLFYVQDASSMLVVEAANPKPHEFVVDVCAAPGGKAIHAAQKMQGTGRVLARDLTPYKAGLLLENKGRCHAKNMEVQVWDARVFDKALEGQADVVVADLPCSGLGVMRRKKDIRYHMTPAYMESLVQLQREILMTVSRYVKPGGRMVYSTCTIHKEENEGNALWFAKQCPDFQLTSGRQILPGESGADGFYIAQFFRRPSQAL